jgi:DNA-binding Lrp family transcriptional regulator
MPSNSNEMLVLKAIIENPKISNMAIAKELGLSSAGIGKIRDKLEKKGIIKEYNVKLNNSAIELNTLAILHVRVTTKGWKYGKGMGIQDYIASNSNVVTIYRVPGRRLTHILICAFRNVKEVDMFLNAIQSQLSDYIEVVESFVFSSDSIIKDSFKDLVVKIINEGDEGKRMPEPVLFGNIIGEEE